MNKALDIHRLKRCEMCSELGKHHVPAEGNPNADIMIVGQSPGETEVREGKPFCGPSGEMLDFMLDEAGLSREQVYITNALKCHPPDNRPGKPHELHLCFHLWLKLEIKEVKPKIIVLVGKDAWKAVTQQRIPFKHGESVKTKNFTFLTVYHPAFFLRQGNVDGFVKVGKILKGLYETN